MRRVLLLDISNNNKSVTLARVKDAGIAGFWHKVSEGETFTDGYWQQRRDQGRSLGLRVGGYHFARLADPADAILEAKHFARKLGKIERRDLCPALDLEVAYRATGGNLVGLARLFNQTFHHITGVWPLFYSYPAFIEALRAERIIGRGLWLASYGRNDGTEHPYVVPKPFRKALAHQFTSEARVPGVSGHADLSSAPKLYPLLARGLRGL